MYRIKISYKTGNSFEDDHIIFKSGREVEIDNLFYEVSGNLYSENGQEEFW